MKLNYEKLKSYSTAQLRDLLTPTYEKIKDKYSFAKIDEKKLEEIMLTSIEEAIIDVEKSKKENLDLIFTKKAKKHIKEHVKNALSNEIEFNTIFNNFVIENIKDTDNYKNSLNELKKIQLLFNEVEFIPTPDLCIEMLKNPIVENITDVVVQKNLNVIKNNNIDNIFKDELLISIIETYCMIKNIKIEENENNYDEYGNDKKEEIESECTSDLVAAYLGEINKPLLSVDEEKELAYRISQGDEEARNIFIERNLKLVVSVAKKYIGRGLQFIDLIQEGNIGLMIAVDKFDATRGYKFSTYAINWIRQGITRAIADKGKNIRIPNHLYEKVGKYLKTRSTLQRELNREPSLKEIADEMKISVEEVDKLYRLQLDTISTSMLIGEDEDSELENFIPSQGPTPEEEVVNSTIQTSVRDLLKKCKLSEKEINVLALRFGFDNEKPMTLEEVGKIYNVTRERIRQIEAKAIIKIRKSRYINDLSIYMEFPAKAMENIKNYKKSYDIQVCGELYDSDKGEKANNIVQTKIQNEKQKEEINENIKESEGKKMGKRTKTIYEYLNGYTEEQIDAMIAKLTDEELRLLKVRYGEDLHNPVTGEEWNQELKVNFYNVLVPRMKRLLKNPDSKKYTRRKKNESQEEIIISPVLVPENEEEITTSNEIEKQDCIRILEMMRTPSFGEMLKTLNTKEAIIICLKLGYIDGKYFSTDSIAEFLGLEKEEIIETTKKVLLLYKENINDLIDNAISVATKPSLVLKNK